MDAELLKLKDLLELLKLNLVNLLMKTVFNGLNLKTNIKTYNSVSMNIFKAILKYGKRKYINNL